MKNIKEIYENQFVFKINDSIVYVTTVNAETLADLIEKSKINNLYVIEFEFKDFKAIYLIVDLLGFGYSVLINTENRVFGFPDIESAHYLIRALRWNKQYTVVYNDYQEF